MPVLAGNIVAVLFGCAPESQYMEGNHLRRRPESHQFTAGKMAVLALRGPMGGKLFGHGVLRGSGFLLVVWVVVVSWCRITVWEVYAGIVRRALGELQPAILNRPG